MAPGLLIVIAVMRQHTIRKAVCLEGVGLHCGKTVRVTLAPSPADSGIVFRVGEHGDPIPATPESVVDSHYATTLGKNGARIQTIEHLMAHSETQILEPHETFRRAQWLVFRGVGLIAGIQKELLDFMRIGRLDSLADTVGRDAAEVTAEPWPS